MRRRAARQGCLLGPNALLLDCAFALVLARSSMEAGFAGVLLLCHDPPLWLESRFAPRHHAQTSQRLWYCRCCCCAPAALSPPSTTMLLMHREPGVRSFRVRRRSPGRLETATGRFARSAVRLPACRSKEAVLCILRDPNGGGAAPFGLCPVLSAENDRPQSHPAVHSSRRPASSAACPASAMGGDDDDAVR